MEKRTEGAWIIHHTKKIQDVTSATEFEDIELAGKCGLFLSSLAASNNESMLSDKTVQAIAKASNIKKIELPTVIATLKDARLIDTSTSGEISVIGLTTTNVLEHTAYLFDEFTDDKFQIASIETANSVSDKPQNEKNLKEYISDLYIMDSHLTNQLFNQSEEIGLIDFELVDESKIYFNGNLFRRDDIQKADRVFSSLSAQDTDKIIELDSYLENEGCITLEFAIKVLGNTLISKLQAIGMYDFNEVSNNEHSQVFLTKPSAFSKFGNPFEEDALDLAKAFIASLMYGMIISNASRGKIRSRQMLINTLKKLLRKERVGPCTAIGQDYQVLELNRVIHLIEGDNNMFYMELLKHDIGQLALEVVQKGNIAETTTLDVLNRSSNISSYIGPEKKRMVTRRKKDISNSLNVSELLKTMRD